MFILSRFNFIMRGGNAAKRPLTDADKTMEKLAKKWKNLPQRGFPKIVNNPSYQGAANLLPLAD